MPLRATLLGLLAVCAALAAAAPAFALDARALRSSLARESGRLGSQAGAHVVDLGSGRTLFTRRADKLLVPASNEKLFTTATALIVLGADARRETHAVARLVDPDAPDERRTIRDLYLVGSGDPSLSRSDLAGLARRLRAAGLRRVRGAVIGDESLLDARRGSVDSAFRPDFNLAGQLGALTISHGATDGVSPARLAAKALQAELQRRGVRVGRAARVGKTPPELVDVVALDRSPTIASLIRATNQPSDNFYAELLLKVVGAVDRQTIGTTAAGAAVATREMRALGLSPQIADGSGLSRRNRTSARQLVTLLTAMRERDDADAWLGSLTVAGRNGTLKRRMRGTAAQGRCRGKTGTLRGVSALSGYCTTTAGRTVAFSLIENGVGSGAKAVEDRMVAAIARYG